jgi:hypothetical protein
LSQNTWKVSSVIANGSDIWGTFLVSDCYKDNEYFFRRDNRLAIYDKASKCDMADPDSVINNYEFTLATLTAGTGITITNTSGTITIAASAVAVRPTTDQFSASANQTSFTLTQTPLTNANSLDNVWMFINGVRTNNLAYSVSGTTVTYVPGSNGSYVLLAGDRIQFDYAY